MIHAVKGIYQDGKVMLEELLPTSYAKVLVTLVDEEDDNRRKIRSL